MITRAKSIITLLCLLGLTILVPPTIAQEKSGPPTQAPARAANHVLSSNSTADYKPLEIGEGTSPSTYVVLALGQATLFRCIEEPLQLVFGDPTGIQLVQATEESKRNEFYLIPTRAGLITNLWIETKTGTITARLKTIAVKGGATLTDYNGEVFVRAQGYHDALITAQTKAADLQRQLTTLQSVTQTKIAEAQHNAALAVDQATTATFSTVFSLLLAEAKNAPLAHGKHKHDGASFLALSASQLTPVRGDSLGRYWLVLQLTVDARQIKHAPGTYVINRIDSQGGSIKVSEALPLTVTPTKPATLAVAVVSDSTTAATSTLKRPTALVLQLSDGKAITVALQP